MALALVAARRPDSHHRRDDHHGASRTDGRPDGCRCDQPSARPIAAVVAAVGAVIAIIIVYLEHQQRKPQAVMNIWTEIQNSVRDGDAGIIQQIFSGSGRPYRQS